MVYKIDEEVSIFRNNSSIIDNDVCIPGNNSGNAGRIAGIVVIHSSIAGKIAPGKTKTAQLLLFITGKEIQSAHVAAGFSVKETRKRKKAPPLIFLIEWLHLLHTRISRLQTNPG